MASFGPDDESRIATLVQLRTRCLASPAAEAQARARFGLSERRFRRLAAEADRRIRLCAEVDLDAELGLSIAQSREMLQQALAARPPDLSLAARLREQLDRKLGLSAPRDRPPDAAPSREAAQLAAVTAHLAPLYPDAAAPPEAPPDPEALAHHAALEILAARGRPAA